MHAESIFKHLSIRLPDGGKAFHQRFNDRPKPWERFCETKDPQQPQQPQHYHGKGFKDDSSRRQFHEAGIEVV